MDSSAPQNSVASRPTGGRRARRVLGLPLRDVLLWLGGCVSAVLLWGWLRADDGASRSPLTDGPSAAIDGAHNIVVRDHGHKVWEFSAGHIEVSANGDHATATDIGNALLYRDGRPYLKLRAQQLRLNQYTRDMTATGAVTAQGMNGITMRTEEALWSQGQNTLQAAGAVNATGPNGFSMQTRDASWHRTTDNIVCPGPVQATFRGMTIASKMVAYDTKKSRLTCPQPLSVTSSRATLRGTRGEADIAHKSVRFQGPMEIVIRAAAVPKLG